MKGLGPLFPFLCLVFLLVRASLAGELSLIISPGSREVFQGGVVGIKVLGEGLSGVKAFRRGREIPFFPGGLGASYNAILGVDLEEKPGPMEVVIQAGSGSQTKVPVVLRVRKKRFTTEHLSVPASFDHFDEMTLERIRRERRRIAQLWSTASRQRWWRGRFVVPVPGEITSPFGLRRVINGSPRSPHGGVDLRASLGAEVVAANYGRVVIRDEFFFSGKSIVLDHGGGLYTAYFHLSDFRVDGGSRVRKGEVIGWAGMTGRATGPHLHWGAYLNGARVDPFGLLVAFWEDW
ncbi:MAG: M23 family metallopeptidase [Candidatus Binatia bacterium]